MPTVLWAGGVVDIKKYMAHRCDVNVTIMFKPSYKNQYSIAGIIYILVISTGKN